MKKKLLVMLLGAALTLTLARPAWATTVPVTEVDTAAAYLKAQGIMIGDENGDLHLDRGLNRGELAAILTRLHSEDDVDPVHYTWACYFSDVPDWAKGYVGYCTAMLLVKGYGDGRYGSGDMVNPQMACTVILRACGYGDSEGRSWSYASACDHAVRLGLLPQAVAQASVITRGEVAVLIYRALMAQAATTPVNTIEAAHWSREDFSQQADPSVFTGPYTRELYNAIRQTMLDGDLQNVAGYRYAYTMVSAGNYSAVKNLLGRMEGVLRYEHHVPAGLTNYYQHPDYFAVSARMPENYQDAFRFIRPVIEQANRYSSDREKVTYLNDYLKSLLLYDSSATAGITQIFSDHEAELKAACGSYARAFNFLCSAAGIPCITIKTNTHGWNLVYTDGTWLHVDVSTNDLTAGNRILLTPGIANRIDTAPEATAFLKELLVPGSTK